MVGKMMTSLQLVDQICNTNYLFITYSLLAIYWWKHLKSFLTLRKSTLHRLKHGWGVDILLLTTAAFVCGPGPVCPADQSDAHSAQTSPGPSSRLWPRPPFGCPEKSFEMFSTFTLTLRLDMSRRNSPHERVLCNKMFEWNFRPVVFDLQGC